MLPSACPGIPKGIPALSADTFSGSPYSATKSITDWKPVSPVVAVSLTLNVSSAVAWKSTNEAVATVAQDGTVTAVSSGNAVITAHH